MRRSLVRASAAALSVSTLTACGGGGNTPALDQAKTKSAPLVAEDLPDGGWTAGKVKEGVTSSSTTTTSSSDSLDKLPGLTQDCRDALKTITEMDFNSAKAQTESNFTKGNSKLSTVVAAYDTLPSGLDKIKDVVGKCPEAKIEENGVSVTMKLSSPSYTTAGAIGLGFSMDLMGKSQAMNMVLVPRGSNIIAALLEGTDDTADRALLQKVIDKADEKFKKVAG